MVPFSLSPTFCDIWIISALQNSEGLLSSSVLVTFPLPPGSKATYRYKYFFFGLFIISFKCVLFFCSQKKSVTVTTGISFYWKKNSFLVFICIVLINSTSDFVEDYGYYLGMLS